MCSVTVKRWHIGTAGAARTAYPCAFLGVLLLEKARKAHELQKTLNMTRPLIRAMMHLEPV
jgi:hypothetical protein